jgi:hypothetical protein
VLVSFNSLFGDTIVPTLTCGRIQMRMQHVISQRRTPSRRRLAKLIRYFT